MRPMFKRETVQGRLPLKQQATLFLSSVDHVILSSVVIFLLKTTIYSVKITYNRDVSVSKFYTFGYEKKNPDRQIKSYKN